MRGETSIFDWKRSFLNQEYRSDRQEEFERSAVRFSLAVRTDILRVLSRRD